MSSGSKAALVAFSVALVAVVALGISRQYVGALDSEVSSTDRNAEGVSLRVCADPNNLPFSNRAGEGFENALAELIAAEMGATVEYTWWPQRRGFVRNTIGAGLCDVIMGVPHDSEMVRTTRPYYRSSYTFVSQRASSLDVTGFDDPRLDQLRIGVHVIGDDYSNVPPVQVLASRGHIENVSGYSIYGDYTQPDPPRELIDAVARGEIDVAIAWGPLAGFFARRASVPLDVHAAADDPLVPSFPMSYAISMGVRRDDHALQAELERILERRRADIDSILSRFDVPRMDLDASRDALSAEAHR